jgi:hypothetical protein
MKALEQWIVLLLIMVIEVNNSGAIKHSLSICPHSFIKAASK